MAEENANNIFALATLIFRIVSRVWVWFLCDFGCVRVQFSDGHTVLIEHVVISNNFMRKRMKRTRKSDSAIRTHVCACNA